MPNRSTRRYAVVPALGEICARAGLRVENHVVIVKTAEDYTKFWTLHDEFLAKSQTPSGE